MAACCSVLVEALGVEAAEDLAKGFAALADPVRLRLFSMIASRSSGEVCACEMAEPLGKSQPTVSHHLKVLFEAGLLERERRGTWIWYWAVPDRVRGLREALSPR